LTRKFALLTVAVLAVAGCSGISTQADEVGVHYKAGPFSATKFANCVGSSTRNYDGPGDAHYIYPAGQRTYDFTGGNGSESGPITVVSKDNQELTVSGVAKFYLDTDCDVLRSFHEQIGLKYKAYMDGDSTSPGWDTMLRTYIGQQLKQAMTTAAQRYDWLDLYNDPATRARWEDEVNRLTPQLVTKFAGAEYFKTFSFTLQKPVPTAGLLAGLAAAQEAVLQRRTIENQNASVIAELDQIKSLTNVLGPYGYILYKALKDCEAEGDNAARACPTLLPVPNGTGINVTPGG
jgi:hypothetical protein